MQCTERHDLTLHGEVYSGSVVSGELDVSHWIGNTVRKAYGRQTDLPLSLAVARGHYFFTPYPLFALNCHNGDVKKKN